MVEKDSMNNLPSLKIYKIDFDFIFANYLNKNLWKKEWCLFEYKNLAIMMSLSSIDITNNKISLKLFIKNGNAWNERTIYSLPLDVSHRNTIVFQKEINKKIYDLLTARETSRIHDRAIWQEASEAEDRANEELEQIAKDFLDREGVSNKAIRDAYIEKYVDDHYKNLTSAVERQLHYKVMPEHFLTFATIIGDEKTYELVTRKNGSDDDWLEAFEEDIADLKESLENGEFYEDMQSELEDL